MNGRLTGAPMSCSNGPLQTLYLSCANIAKVMSPNNIYLLTDVCMDTGPLLLIQNPRIHPGMLRCDSVFQPRRNAAIVRYGWDTKGSDAQTTVGGLGFTGPRDAEIAGAHVTHHFPSSIIITQCGFKDVIPFHALLMWSDKKMIRKSNVFSWNWYNIALSPTVNLITVQPQQQWLRCWSVKPASQSCWPGCRVILSDHELNSFFIRSCNQDRKSIKPGSNQQERICFFLGRIKSDFTPHGGQRTPITYFRTKYSHS